MQARTSKFILIADPQFGLVSFKRAQELAVAASGKTQINPAELLDSNWDTERDRLARAVQVANGLRPDFVAVLGDMVMDWDNQRQVDDVKSELSRLDTDIPVRWVAGNHDVGIDFRTPDPASLETYRQNYGPDHYSFTAGSCKFVVINTALFDKPDGVPEATQEQRKWLEAEFSAPLPSGVTHRIVLSHHPLFLENIDEEYGTYNLPVPERNYLAELFLESGVSHMFTGHTHSNGIVTYGGLKIVMTTSIGSAKASRRGGYRIVTASPDTVHHSFYELS